MTAVHMHDNPSLFPEPRRFDPERWLGAKEEAKRLQKYVVPFSRGTRACLGMKYASTTQSPFLPQSNNPKRVLDLSLTRLSNSLAICEIYLAIAAVFRPYPVPPRNINPDASSSHPMALNLELYETDVSDVEMAHDFFNPIPRLDSKGVRVKVT